MNDVIKTSAKIGGARLDPNISVSERMPAQIACNQVDTFISDAISSGQSVETIRELMTMRSDLKKEYSKEQFFIALSNFQAAIPDIEKTTIVKNKNGTERYRYSPLDNTVKTVRPHMADNGLSYTTKTTFSEGIITARVEIHHALGHSEVSEFITEIDQDAYMNDTQKRGSARSFAKRYAFEDALGLMASELDDDAQAMNQEPEYITADQVAVIENLIKVTGKDTDQLIKWCKSESVETIFADKYNQVIVGLNK